MQTDEDRLIDAKTLGAMLGYSTRTVYNYAADSNPAIPAPCNRGLRKRTAALKWRLSDVKTFIANYSECLVFVGVSRAADGWRPVVSVNGRRWGGEPMPTLEAAAERAQRHFAGETHVASN